MQTIEVTNEQYRTVPLSEIGGGLHCDWYDFESLSGQRRFKSRTGIKRAIANFIRDLELTGESAVIVYGPIQDHWQANVRYVN